MSGVRQTPGRQDNNRTEYRTVEILETGLLQGDPSVLEVSGEIDLATAEQLRTALEEALSTDPHVVVDMAGVTFLDATGLHVILQVATSLDGTGPLQLRNASRVAWILEVVGLSGLTSIVIEDEGDASGR